MRLGMGASVQILPGTNNLISCTRSRRNLHVKGYWSRRWTDATVWPLRGWKTLAGFGCAKGFEILPCPAPEETGWQARWMDGGMDG